MTTMLNPLPVLASPEWAVPLAPCVYDERGLCAYCDGEPTQRTYESYLDWWYDVEYEYEPGHNPWTRETWDYLQASCDASLPHEACPTCGDMLALSPASDHTFCPSCA